jgi:hypothetical protein
VGEAPTAADASIQNSTGSLSAIPPHTFTTIHKRLDGFRASCDVDGVFRLTPWRHGTNEEGPGDMKSDAALVLSVAALLISFAALYFNKLQPGKPAGGLSYAMIWRFSNLPNFTETDFTFSPVLWITNMGVRPLVIVNLRLRLSPEKVTNLSPTPQHHSRGSDHQSG